MAQESSEKLTDTGPIAGTQPQSFREALAEAWAAREKESTAPTESQDDQPAGTAASGADGSDTPDPVEVPPETAREKPQHWSDEDWNLVKDLPDAAYKVVLQKEKDFQSGFTRKTEELAQQRKRYDALERTLSGLHTKYAGQADRQQFDQVITQVLPDLLGNYVGFQRNPVETLMRLAEQAGVADKLMESLAGQDEGTRTSRMEKAALERRAEQAEMDRERLHSERVQAQIDAFRSATKADGSPKYPYFDELQETMARLVTADRLLTLEQAYDKAVKLDKFDEIQKAEREKLKAEVKAELEAERRQKAKEGLKTAKPNGRAGTADVKQTPKTRREELLSGWDERFGTQ